jgi:hypothetical protein
MQNPVPQIFPSPYGTTLVYYDAKCDQIVRSYAHIRAHPLQKAEEWTFPVAERCRQSPCPLSAHTISASTGIPLRATKGALRQLSRRGHIRSIRGKKRTLFVRILTGIEAVKAGYAPCAITNPLDVPDETVVSLGTGTGMNFMWCRTWQSKRNVWASSFHIASCAYTLLVDANESPCTRAATSFRQILRDELKKPVDIWNLTSVRDAVIRTDARVCARTPWSNCSFALVGRSNGMLVALTSGGCGIATSVGYMCRPVAPSGPMAVCPHDIRDTLGDAFDEKKDPRIVGYGRWGTQIGVRLLKSKVKGKMDIPCCGSGVSMVEEDGTCILLVSSGIVDVFPENTDIVSFIDDPTSLIQDVISCGGVRSKYDVGVVTIPSSP